MNDTGMFTLMSEAQRKEWDTQLYSDDCPEITLDNVIATFRALNASKGETFEQGVIDVFRNLSWDYKTHNPCFLGKKLSLMVSWIIIAGCIFPCARMHRTASMTLPARSGSSTERPYPTIASPRGKPERVYQSGRCEERGEVFTCEYFTVRTYKKGSAHVTFTRPDLVEKVNDIIARHYPGALPPVV